MNRFLFLTFSSAVLLAVFFGLLSKPLNDIDLWWHLATGRHYLATKAFLSADPFSIAGADISPGRTMILNGYFLAQIVMYSSYLLADEWGIVLLRAILLTAVPATLLLYGCIKGLRSWELAIITTLCSWVLLRFGGDRPNLFTILFVPLLILLFNEIGYFKKHSATERKGYNLRWAIAAVPFMLVWANLHGGFMLGSTLILVYLMGETVKKFIFRQKIPLRVLLGLWWWLSVALGATVCNPNGASAYRALINFEGSIIQQKTLEYLSPFKLAAGGEIIYPYFFLLVLIPLLILAQWRRLDFTEAALALFLLAISTTALRYVPLFAGGTSLFATKLLISTTSSHSRITKGLPTISLALLLTVGYWVGSHTRQVSFSSVIAPGRFPIAACNFLEQNGIEGTLFNHFDWGGYLAWRGTPKFKTFIDGRSLNEPLLNDYMRVLWIPDAAQDILDRFNVSIVVMPRLNPLTGELYALTDLMYYSRNWALIYRDDTAMVLIRKGSFPALNQIRELPKLLIYQDTLADTENRLLAGNTSEHLLRAKRIAMNRLAKNPI